MKRRSLLAGLTGGLSALAGCNGLGDVAGRQTREPFQVDGTATQRPAPTFASAPPTDPTRTAVSHLGEHHRRLAVVDVDGGPDSLDVRVGFTADGSTNTPPRLWIGATNTFPSAGEFSFPGVVPFGGLVGRTAGDDLSDADTMVERPQLVLVPVMDERFSSVRPTEPSEGCWSAANSIPVDVEGTTVTIESDETVGREYLVLTDPGSDTCLQRGVYRFESAVPNLTFGLSVWDPTAVRAAESVFAGDEDPFAGGPVPSLPDCSPEWFHNARDTGMTAYLTPSQERVRLPGSISVTLSNYGSYPVAPTRVQLYRWHVGRWVPLRPPARIQRSYPALGPGQTVTRSLALGQEAEDIDEAARTVAIPGLRTGRYAVRFGSVDHEVRSSCVAALLELSGETVSLAPTSHVEATEQHDETVVVRSTRRQRGDPFLECIRVDDAAETLLFEQVMQLDGLRNTLSYLRGDDSVAAVYLHTSPRVIGRALGAVGLEQVRTRRFVFEGQAYQVRRTRRGL
ncbi:hypothetical protein [Haloarchaeobius sp. HME9146]|uniref:hypothetical protein n=1 Tax=Haloarchaeobius sp. HME9146 TaxID=2978732 RepID=UPI0021C1C92C|nr:hypothetical protein [Haloarchaeobius sp. HME9146]MCT9096309.1 hypothetical protein [Haloarchaeobius sp. HME9146]